MPTKKHLISFVLEEKIYLQLLETINFLKTYSIHPTGNLSTSRIVRIALVDFMEKQEKIKKVTLEKNELNITIEQMLKENARL